MTVAQKVVELANTLGVDISDSKTGNIAGLINAITLKKGGEIANNQNIQLALVNLAKAIGKEGIPLSKNIQAAIDQLKEDIKEPAKPETPVTAPVKDEKEHDEKSTKVEAPVEPEKVEQPKEPDAFETEDSETAW